MLKSSMDIIMRKAKVAFTILNDKTNRHHKRKLYKGGRNGRS